MSELQWTALAVLVVTVLFLESKHEVEFSVFEKLMTFICFLGGTLVLIGSLVLQG